VNRKVKKKHKTKDKHKSTFTHKTTDIEHPSFSWLGTGIFTWRKVWLNKVLYMKMLRKRCLKTVIFVLESPWKVLDFAQQKSVWTLGEVYLMQHYVIKFVSDLLQVGDFFWILRFPPPMKVALNAITLTLYIICSIR
jgi:hypothetical protein